MSRLLSLDVDDSFDIEQDNVVRACSSAWAPTARWAPTRTASRSSASWRAFHARPISSTTPRNPARRRFPPALRARAHRRALPYAVGELHRLPPVRFRVRSICWSTPPRGDPAAQQPLSSRRVVAESCPSGCAPDCPQGHPASTPSTPTRSREENGMGRRINTIMQTCFFKLAGVIDTDEAIAAIKDGRSKRPTQEGRGPGEAQLRGSGPGAGTPQAGERRRGQAQRHQRLAPTSTCDGADLRARHHRRNAGRTR
jgi:hypothetical protein